MEIFPADGRNLYRLAVVRLDTTTAKWLIIGSTYENRVCAFTSDGDHLWDASVGGFVFDLGTGAWTATDRLTGQKLSTLDNGLALTVPAVGLRILESHRAAP